eukprot:2871471-Prymnesium_polylepis.1
MGRRSLAELSPPPRSAAGKKRIFSSRRRWAHARACKSEKRWHAAAKNMALAVKREDLHRGVAPLARHRPHVRDAFPVAVVRDVGAKHEGKSDHVGEDGVRIGVGEKRHEHWVVSQHHEHRRDRSANNGGDDGPRDCGARAREEQWQPRESAWVEDHGPVAETRAVRREQGLFTACAASEYTDAAARGRVRC